MMKALSIALIVLSLFLPAGICANADVGDARLHAGLNLRDPSSTPDTLDVDSAITEEKHDAVRWYNRQAHTELRGLALVIHGLNCRPDKMKAIISALNTSGIDCLNLSLRGHGTNFTPIHNMDEEAARMAAFKSVSYPLWKTEAYIAYRMVKKRSAFWRKPIFLVGFSMGGLLGVDLMTSNPNVKFDKMVLFAPAIAMLQRNYLIQFFAPFPNLVIPSVGNKAYLAHAGTPMAAYNALFDMYAHFEEHLDPMKINIPAVVFIDAEDELVSYGSLQKMVQVHHLDQWQIYAVKKDKTATEVDMHHLIIDAVAVGKHRWQEMVEVTTTHLLGGQSTGTAD